METFIKIIIFTFAQHNYIQVSHIYNFYTTYNNENEQVFSILKAKSRIIPSICKFIWYTGVYKNTSLSLDILDRSVKQGLS